jgi:hypothetical protein
MEVTAVSALFALTRNGEDRENVVRADECALFTWF